MESSGNQGSKYRLTCCVSVEKAFRPQISGGHRKARGEVPPHPKIAGHNHHSSKNEFLEEMAENGKLEGGWVEKDPKSPSLYKKKSSQIIWKKFFKIFNFGVGKNLKVKSRLLIFRSRVSGS